jgi:hypothetical protein
MSTALRRHGNVLAVAQRAGKSEDSAASLFADLVRAWRHGIKFESSTTRILGHPAFRRIVALGEPAIPLILREIQREPDHLSFALREITGTSPVPAGAAGNMARIAALWLAWGRKQGYVW